MSAQKPTTTLEANQEFRAVTDASASPSNRKDRRTKTVTFLDQPVKAEDDQTSQLRGTSGRDLTSSHDLFFDAPEYKTATSKDGRFRHHFVLNMRTFLSLLIEVVLIILRLIWGIVVLVFRFIWLILKSIGQIILCVLLAVFLFLTSCCPGRAAVFVHDEHLQDLKSIRWKNIHKLFLFLRLEPLIVSHNEHSALKDGVSKLASKAELVKSIPVKNLQRLISSVN